MVKDYFQDLSKYPNSQSIENALNLATILYAATKLDLINLSEELIVNWFDQIEAIVQQSLDKSTEPFEKCSLLEVMGFLRMHQRQYGFRQLKISEVMEPFEKILELLNESPQYPVSQLEIRLIP
ncbi:MAG: hypothetical protein R2813_11895 [Flavobacteriales bacterium]